MVILHMQVSKILIEEDDEHILISYNKRRPKYRDIHKLNIYTGRTTDCC